MAEVANSLIFNRLAKRYLQCRLKHLLNLQFNALGLMF